MINHSTQFCMHRPHAFKAVYAVTLHGELLRTDLRIINTGDKPFEFTAALHTYIEVLDINKATVKGLKDLEYLDKVSRFNDVGPICGTIVVTCHHSMHKALQSSSSCISCCMHGLLYLR
jgi:D-hexose-6-phosphate mutarotase